MSRARVAASARTRGRRGAASYKSAAAAPRRRGGVMRAIAVAVAVAVAVAPPFAAVPPCAVVPPTRCAPSPTPPPAARADNASHVRYRRRDPGRRAAQAVRHVVRAARVPVAARRAARLFAAGVAAGPRAVLRQAGAGASAAAAAAAAARAGRAAAAAAAAARTAVAAVAAETASVRGGRGGRGGALGAQEGAHGADAARDGGDAAVGQEHSGAAREGDSRGPSKGRQADGHGAAHPAQTAQQGVGRALPPAEGAASGAFTTENQRHAGGE
ncbi:zinc finger CCCH domain containing protein [Gracilaria domingensis]|nr:zinc finger CCCH domain containing protein [Gracilaria domingensis]